MKCFGDKFGRDMMSVISPRGKAIVLRVLYPSGSDIIKKDFFNSLISADRAGCSHLRMPALQNSLPYRRAGKEVT
jgi:hypothetical protein